MGNMPWMREYHSETFTTDSLGFHNPASLPGVPEIIVLGDSFALAAEVPENQSFSAELADLRGRVVYNAAGEEPLRLAPLRYLARRLDMPRGYVVYELLERHLTESPPLETETGSTGLSARLKEIVGTERWEEFRLPIWHLVEFSPLQALAQKMDKQISDNVLLPNRYSQNVLVRRLSNGDSMLFLPKDLSNEELPPSQIGRWSRYLSWLSDQLQKDDLRLVVLLVPNKYTVYQPFIVPPTNDPQNGRDLCELNAQLTAKNVPMVSLLDRYHRDAAAGLGQHVYIYLRDDTHWNQRGIRVASELVAQFLSREDLQQIHADRTVDDTSSLHAHLERRQVVLAGR